MAVDNSKLLYLLDPAFQIENIAGKPAVGGHIEVFYAGTDVKVITKQNFDGVDNPFKVPLNNDGRAVMLVSPGAKYDIYFYDSFNNLIFSRLNVFAQGEGEGSVSGLTQIFHDDTLTGDGSYHDPLGAIEYTGILPIDVNNDLHLISAQTTRLGVQEPLYFVQDDDEMTVIGLSGETIPEGTMNESAFGYQDGQITGYNGSAFSAGNSYEAGSYVDIDGNTINVTGLTPVPADTASTGLVASVSADITAMIPDTSDMATQTWVNEQGFLTAHQDLSEYAKTEDLTAYQEKGNYYSASNPSGFINSDAISSMATTGFVADVSGDITALIPSTAGLATQDWVTGQGYLTAHQSLDGLMSADLLEISDNKITGYNGTAFAGQGGGVTGDFTLVEGNGIQLTDDPIAQTTTISVSGDYATNTQLQTVSADITAMIPTALTGEYVAGNNESGFAIASNSGSIAVGENEYLGSQAIGITKSNSGIWLSPNQLEIYGNGVDETINANDISALKQLSSEKADTTALTAYQEITGMTAYQAAGDYLSANALDNLSGNWETVTGKQDSLTFGYHDTAISSIDNSAVYDNSAHARINTLAGRISDLSSNKLDTTAFSDVSGTFLTAHQSLADYQLTADMTGYLTTGDSANFLTAVPTGTMNESAFGYDANDKISGYNGSAFAGGSEVPEGVMVESGLEYNAVNEISAYNGSAIAQYGAEKQWLVHDDTLVHASNSAQYALGVNLSAIAQLLGIDETVLWSGTTINWSAQTVNLSDNIYNYNRIRLEYFPWASQDSIHCIEFIPKSDFPVFSFNDCFIDAWNYTSASQPYMTVNSLHYTSGTLTVDKNWIRDLTATNWSERNDGRLLKVVGIGRKEV